MVELKHCIEMENLIHSYLNRSIAEEEYTSLLNHILLCSDCRKYMHVMKSIDLLIYECLKKINYPESGDG